MQKSVGLILAKGESKRLPNKNVMMFCGKPMFLWNVERSLSIFDKTYVSSDNIYILNLAERLGAIPITRSRGLCGDTPNITVYKHAQKTMKADIIIALQANSPTIEYGVIEMARELMCMMTPEMMTCDEKYKIYGSVWGISRERLETYRDPYKPTPDILLLDESVDIHDMKDFKKAEKQWTLQS